MTGQDFIRALSSQGQVLKDKEWGPDAQLFTLTLRTMVDDAHRWLENEWETPGGTKTSEERAVVVLCQDLMVLLGHAAHAGIVNGDIVELAKKAMDATAAGVIQDETHRSYFSAEDSPLQAILSSVE